MFINVVLLIIGLRRRQMFPTDSDLDEEQDNEIETNSNLEHRVEHQLHLVRFDLMQFVNGLHQYIMTRVKFSRLVLLVL